MKTSYLKAYQTQLLFDCTKLFHRSTLKWTNFDPKICLEEGIGWVVGRILSGLCAISVRLPSKLSSYLKSLSKTFFSNRSGFTVDRSFNWWEWWKEPLPKPRPGRDDEV